MSLSNVEYISIFYVLVSFFHKTRCETCFNMFKDQKYLSIMDDDNLLFNPDRYWRFNSAKMGFDKLEYVKPNESALCSVDFKNDLQGKTLKVFIPAEIPQAVLIENKTKVTGFLGEVWTIIQDALKFRSEYTSSLEGFSVLQNGEFDVLLTGATMTYHPTVYYVPSTVITQDTYSLFAVPEGTFVSKWWYIHIFHAYVWILSTGFVILLTLSMVGIYTMKSKWCKKTESCREFGDPSFNLLCVLGATSGQGFQEIPRSWSLRICTLTALCMGMLLSCGFNSTLTSYLAFRAPYVAINEIDDLWRVKTHSVCVRKYSNAHSKLEKVFEDSTTIESLKEKRKNRINQKCPRMKNETDFRQNICKPGFVYIEIPSIFLKQYRHVQHKCQIMKVRTNFQSTQISFPHYRGSKYWKVINAFILRLHSAGIMKYLEDKWRVQHNVPYAGYSNYQNYQQVELDHVQLLIVGLVIAMIISIIICIFENIWFRMHNSAIAY